MAQPAFSVLPLVPFLGHCQSCVFKMRCWSWVGLGEGSFGCYMHQSVSTQETAPFNEVIEETSMKESSSIASMEAIRLRVLSGLRAPPSPLCRLLSLLEGSLKWLVFPFPSLNLLLVLLHLLCNPSLVRNTVPGPPCFK